jgi:hypothetical protein
VQHAGKEEIALYPAFLRDIASLGEAEVEQAKKEHLQVTNDLYQLDQLLPNAKDGRAIPQMDDRSPSRSAAAIFLFRLSHLSGVCVLWPLKLLQSYDIIHVTMKSTV